MQDFSVRVFISFLLYGLALNYWCKFCFIILYRKRNKAESFLSDLLIYFHRAGVIHTVYSPSLSWLDRGGGGSLSLSPFSAIFSSLSSSVSRDKRRGKKGQRRLTSTGWGKSNGKREVERQPDRVEASVKRWREPERQRERGRSKERALEC